MSCSAACDGNEPRNSCFCSLLSLTVNSYVLAKPPNARIHLPGSISIVRQVLNEKQADSGQVE
jgi:hypothetical protein